jgi:hypothetical protein
METTTAPPVLPAVASRQTHQLIGQLKEFYAGFSLESLSSLDAIYTLDVEFRDPVHTLHGCLALKAYFRRMAANLKHYRIRYLEEHIGPESAWLGWEMEIAHERLNGGKVITLRGMSHLRYTSKVYSHEDCYDLGALLYEQVPLLGAINRLLKRRMAG